jgi:hypothetical protein
MIKEAYTTDKILIFDIDDTIAISSAKIVVTDSSTGKIFELTPEEFNSYEKNPKHIVNFDQFRSLEIMKAGRLIDKYFNILKKNYNSGVAIGIITARDNQTMIYEWLRYHVGFHIDKKLIWAVNDPVHGLTGTIQERKQQAMRWFIEHGYTDITFFDDDKHNIKLINQLGKELNIPIKTHLAKK